MPFTQRTTQTTHPWRATVRTIFAAVGGLAAGAPLLYLAWTGQSPEQAAGSAAAVLGVTAAITRILALPWTETFLRQFVPWLAAATNAPPSDAVEGE